MHTSNVFSHQLHKHFKKDKIFFIMPTKGLMTASMGINACHTFTLPVNPYHLFINALRSIEDKVYV